MALAWSVTEKLFISERLPGFIQVSNMCDYDHGFRFINTQLNHTKLPYNCNALQQLL